MALHFNGVEISTNGDVTFGGQSFREVRFNGVVFWTKGSGVVTPPAPGFCDASDTLEARVLIQWGYSGYTVGYEVYRSDDDGATFSVIAHVTDGELFHEDLNVVKDKVYQYKVKACDIDTGACSDFSETDTGVSIDTDCSDCAPITAPFELLASDAVYYDRITLTWKNGDIDPLVGNINVYRYNIKISDWVLLDVVTYPDSNYIDYNVRELETHQYRLAYRNTNGIGPYSNEDEGSTRASTPGDVPPHGHTCDEVGAPCGSWIWDAGTGILSITIP